MLLYDYDNYMIISHFPMHMNLFFILDKKTYKTINTKLISLKKAKAIVNNLENPKIKWYHHYLCF